MTTPAERNIDALPAGPELDALVAERVMGTHAIDWHPSTDVAAALQALMRVAGPKHWSYHLYNADGTGAEPLAWCEIRRGNHTVVAEGAGGNPAPPDFEEFDTEDPAVALCLAICRACLKAVPVREQWDRDTAAPRAFHA